MTRDPHGLLQPPREVAQFTLETREVCDLLGITHTLGYMVVQQAISHARERNHAYDALRDAQAFRAWLHQNHPTRLDKAGGFDDWTRTLKTTGGGAT